MLLNNERQYIVVEDKYSLLRPFSYDKHIYLHYILPKKNSLACLHNERYINIYKTLECTNVYHHNLTTWNNLCLYLHDTSSLVNIKRKHVGVIRVRICCFYEVKLGDIRLHHGRLQFKIIESYVTWIRLVSKFNVKGCWLLINVQLCRMWGYFIVLFTDSSDTYAKHIKASEFCLKHKYFV